MKSKIKEKYNIHSLLCPYCDYEYLYSYKLYIYSDDTVYECLNCKNGFFTTLNWVNAYIDGKTKEIFSSKKIDEENYKLIKRIDPSNREIEEVRFNRYRHSYSREKIII